MFCAQCGTKLDDGAAFCHNCGAKQTPSTHSAEIAPVDKTMGIFDEIPKGSQEQSASKEVLYIKPGIILHGRYTIGQVLGHGGFGITYIGTDNSLQLKVAIKEFFPHPLVTRNNTISENVECLNSQELFETEKSKVINEARILAKFAKTPGIVNVLEYFEENNTAYIVMEFLEGQTLKEYIKANGILSAEHAFSLLHPIIQVVDQLHRENLIHRDISPDNIMFDDGKLKLLDFGAAREVLGNTSDGLSVVLKQGYAPAEQYSRSGNQGPWTDIYSLCASIYYCITGKTPPASLERVNQDILQRPSQLGAQITPAQENTLMQGLGIYPEQRFANVAEFTNSWLSSSVSGTAFTGNANSNNGAFVFTSNSNILEPKSAHKSKNKMGPILGVIGGCLLLLIILSVILFGGKNSGDDGNKDVGSTGTTPPHTSFNDATVSTGAEDPIEEAIAKAKQKADENDFDGALVILDTAEQIHGANNRISTVRKEIEKNKALFNLKKYESTGDYAGAIKYCNEELKAFSNDIDIVEKLNTYIREYRNNVLNTAETKFGSSGYEAAIEVLNDALKILPDDEQINAAIEKYSTYAPISVAKLEYFSGGDFGLGNNKKDNLGTTHDNVVYPIGKAWGNAYVINTYKLNKQYSKLSGVWFQYYDNRTSNMPWSDYKSRLEIYGDGKLLYSGEMGPGIEPININLDISNVNELKIDYYAGEQDGPYSGIENFCVQK